MCCCRGAGDTVPSLAMQTLTPGSILGHAVRRREDPRLITGTGRYVDDIQQAPCLHVAFVRSTLAHATIRAVDSAAAAAAPGVVAVFTAADMCKADFGSVDW